MAEHFCTMHKTVFFMRGNMRGYAHPIGEKDEATDKYPEGWCNEEDLEKVRNLPAQSPDKVLPEHQEEIDKAKKAVTKREPTGQEVGLWWKEAGELYRMWEMHPEIRPDKPWAKTFVAAYFAQMFSVLPIKKEE